MPPSYDGGPLTFEGLFSEEAGATLHGVALGFACRLYSAGEALDQAMGAEVVALGTGTATTLEQTARTAPVTPAGPAVGASLLKVRVQRVLADGGDTLDVGADIQGIRAFPVINAANDG
jgi:hypothetical protein